MEELTQKLRKFAAERDWEQFHSPKNLAMALSVEVAELAEHFQWLTEEESYNLSLDKIDKIKEELTGNNNHRDSKWTESIGVGNKLFLKIIKEILGIRAGGRSIVKTEDSDSYQLRENRTSYGVPHNEVINNKFLWNI
jgi:hypothetical protein